MNDSLTLADIAPYGYGTPSRGDKTALRVTNALLKLGIFERGHIHGRPFSGICEFEAYTAAKSLGMEINHKTFQAVESMIWKLEGKGFITRTESGVRFARGFYEAAEDVDVDHDDESLAPLVGVVVSEAMLNDIADQYENVMIMDGERLRVMDMSYGCRRVVRQILLIAGAIPTAHVVSGQPKGLRYNYLGYRRVGTAGIAAASSALQERIENDPRFTAPMERFWQVSAFVFRSLGATVEADVDALFASETDGDAISWPVADAFDEALSDDKLPF